MTDRVHSGGVPGDGVLASVRDELLAAGLPPGSFRIAGVHEEDPLPTDFWFLRPAGPGWEVGAYERGRWEVRGAYGSAAEAGGALVAALTGRPARF